MLTEAELSNLHSKKIVLRNREFVLTQLLRQVTEERERIRKLKRLIKRLRSKL